MYGITYTYLCKNISLYSFSVENKYVQPRCIPYIKSKRCHTRSADNDRLYQVNKMKSKWLCVSDNSKTNQLNQTEFASYTMILLYLTKSYSDIYEELGKWRVIKQ